MLARVIEALGLGAARDARLLVARLLTRGAIVATLDEVVARALVRAQHRCAAADEQAEAALALGLPDGDEALAVLERLARATRAGGTVQVAVAPSIGRAFDRARVAGLFLRAGLVELRQEIDSGVVYTSGRVHPIAAPPAG